MSWGCPPRDVIKSLFSGYIPLDSKDIQVQSFGHMTSKNLKW